jgi:hypothetical protein
VLCCGFDNLTSFFLEQIDDDVGHDELRSDTTRWPVRNLYCFTILKHTTYSLFFIIRRKCGLRGEDSRSDILRWHYNLLTVWHTSLEYHTRFLLFGLLFLGVPTVNFLSDHEESGLQCKTLQRSMFRSTGAGSRHWRGPETHCSLSV